MKRLLVAGLMALGFACTARPAQADCMFDYSCCRHFSYVHTSKNRCLTYSSHSNPLPCAPACGPSCGPAMWDGMAAYGAYAAPAYGYGYPSAYGYGYAAPAVTAPAATTPSTAPSFQAPQPKSAPTGGNGLQQAAYFYYAPTANAGYGSASCGYGYGYGYGAGYGFQAPNYWYDR